MYKPNASRLPVTQMRLWPPRYSPPNIAARLLRHIAAYGWAESLFAFAADHAEDYSSTWRMVRYLARTNQVSVWVRPGYPTVITSPQAQPTYPACGLRHFPHFRGEVVGRTPGGEALVMVQHSGGSGYPARHVAVIELGRLESVK